MDSPSAKLLVLVGKEFARIKITGRATFNLSHDFQTLVTQLRERGFSRFDIDLSECALMDSTFLGVLAGFGLKTRQPNDGTTSGQVTLLSPNSRVKELLKNLGVLQLFKIAKGELAKNETVSACPPTPGHATPEELARTCLEAHETLMAVNPENVARFKDVAKFLAEDLQKLGK